MITATLTIPQGRLCATTDDDAAAQQRRRIAQMLRNGQTVSINSNGTVHQPGQAANAAAGNNQHVVEGEVELVVPKGKLARS